MKRPKLVYDGDCGFCRRWVERWRRRTGDAVVYEAARGPEPPRSVRWEGPDGVAEGADAVFRLLGGPWRWAYRRLPGFAPVSETLYRIVANRRPLFSRLDRLLIGGSPEPVGRWFGLLLRLLALVNLCAFLSLWDQAAGLWGEKGVLPVAELLEHVKSRAGAQSYRLLPTVFWLGASNEALYAACAAGSLLAAAAAFGLFTGPAFLGMWALYLSFLNAGRDFMAFQWDILLLEITFVAALCAPWRPKADLSRWDPPSSGLWLMRLVLFKLMLQSGLVKLRSGDQSWRDLTALTYHYFTQPLPVWTSWYAHHLPLWLHKASAAAMFAVELGAPVLIFAPRRPRRWAFWALLALQGLIAATGNYCFFNLLTAVLCLSLLHEATTPRPWLRPAFALLLLLNAGEVLRRPPQFLSFLGPLHLSNSYGLFAVMTKTRPEIQLEGSADGAEWKEYRFKWKPGDPARRPRFVVPHQPRLDWQMWFASLGDCRGNPWLMAFMGRLLEGEPKVSALLAVDPFAGGPPPKYIRSTVWRYEFTKPGEEGWWKREKLGPYCPPVSLRAR